MVKIYDEFKLIITRQIKNSLSLYSAKDLHNHAQKSAETVVTVVVDSVHPFALC